MSKGFGEAPIKAEGSKIVFDRAYRGVQISAPAKEYFEFPFTKEEFEILANALDVAIQCGGTHHIIEDVQRLFIESAKGMK